MERRILIVLTSHEEMEHTDSKTGVWLSGFTDPYYEFIDADYQVTLASPLGGRPPIDPLSELVENRSEANRRFYEDGIAKKAFNSTKMLRGINATDYDAVFYPGGYGPIWDLATDEDSGLLILKFYNSGKPIGAVCHSPAALIKAAELQPGFLAGKNISVFTNMEEMMVRRGNNIPYMLETRLKELGARVRSSLIPFMSHVVIDGALITGQNPLSARPTAKALIKMLEGNLES
ncbi:type 1 glutamine amidotransferase domain-containing protein [Pedobacter sp. B4-66]|uniref:type 1 glutamine amidotransferase domain-containing protein n=1 Tax=Pedobacter sp. B4-66 TaxID=2817280 RepID=UPI001BDB5C70|nr:type 1 glutamine amidotransferase domain-containing protein [Pedobacter sp. B4-66]